MLEGKPETGMVATREQVRLPLRAALPNRPDRVDHEAGLQAISGSNACLTRRAAADPVTFGQQFRSGRTMDSTIHATTTAKRGIGRVDDGIDVHLRDIGLSNLQSGCDHRQATTG